VIFTLFQGIQSNKIYILRHHCTVSFKFIYLFVYFAFVLDLDFTFLEMNPFTLVDGKPYPLDMRGELDDTAAFKNFKK
jgi:succinyl-CoA synthetase beta subunit